MHKHTCPVCDATYDVADDIRSLPHLRRYMALCRAAHFHWPETHPQQFANWRSLRVWLQMKVGHRKIGNKIPLVGVPKNVAIILAEAALRGANSNSMVTYHGGQLIVWQPKSIAFAKLKHYDAVDLFEKVAAVIHAEIGIDSEELLANPPPSSRSHGP